MTYPIGIFIFRFFIMSDKDAAFPPDTQSFSSGIVLKSNMYFMSFSEKKIYAHVDVFFEFFFFVQVDAEIFLDVFFSAYDQLHH